MSLSCGCDFDPDDYDRWWLCQRKFKPMKMGRRKRCCSCNDLIKPASDVIEFSHYRRTRDGIEEDIYDGAFPLASSFMCEECSGLYLALDELGYGCLDITKSMKGYVVEYNEMRNQ